MTAKHPSLGNSTTLPSDVLQKYLVRIEKLVEIYQLLKKRGDVEGAKQAQARAMGFLKVINDNRVDKRGKPFSIRIWLPKGTYNNITPISPRKFGNRSRRVKNQNSSSGTVSLSRDVRKNVSSQRSISASRALRGFHVLPDDAPAIKAWKYHRQEKHYDKMISQFERLVKLWRGRGDETRAQLFEQTINEYQTLLRRAVENTQTPPRKSPKNRLPASSGRATHKKAARKPSRQ